MVNEFCGYKVITDPFHTKEIEVQVKKKWKDYFTLNNFFSTTKTEIKKVANPEIIIVHETATIICHPKFKEKLAVMFKEYGDTKNEFFPWFHK